MSDKKIVYWGAGNVCKNCLEHYPHIKPEFIIDTFTDKKEINGIKIVRPEDVQKWDDYQIVITMVGFYDISKQLKDRKIKCIDYKSYFGSCGLTAKDSILQILKNERKNRDTLLIVAPVFLARQSKMLINFFKEYIKRYKVRHKEAEVVLLSSTGVVNLERFEQEMQCLIYDIPLICRFELGNNVPFVVDEKINIQLMEDEKKWIYHLNSFKADVPNAQLYTTEVFKYYKEVLTTLNVQKLIIWGPWLRESLILEYLAKKLNIRYGFMEYGWIPGTIQFDKSGLAGRSEYVYHPECLDDIEIEKDDYNNIKKIKCYILNKKLDTGVFLDTVEDDSMLNKIDRTKKTVFLVGTGDKIIAVKPQSEFWKNYVSATHSSMEDVLEDVMKVCKNNNLNLIYKPHPGSRLENADKFIKEGLIYIQEKQIDELIQMSDVVVSMVSAVDFKCLMYGVPLVQVGVTSFHKKNCTYEVEEKEQLEDKIKIALKQGMTSVQKYNFDRFLIQLLKRYLWDDLSNKDFQYGLTFEERDFFD